MASLITKQKEVQFNVGDRVIIKIIDEHDNYSPSYKKIYGYASKVNKRTMQITGVNGECYKASISEVKLYQDPFSNINSK